MSNKYGFGKQVDMPFGQAIERVTQALQAEGFGVLTDIDVAATLKKKLNQDMPPYHILGDCNPPLAHRVLSGRALNRATTAVQCCGAPRRGWRGIRRDQGPECGARSGRQAGYHRLGARGAAEARAGAAGSLVLAWCVQSRGRKRKLRRQPEAVLGGYLTWIKMRIESCSTLLPWFE